MSAAPQASAAPGARPSPWVALGYRDFRLVWLGQMVSFAGTEMQLVTINWHIYNLTDSPVALGLVGLVRVVPIIALSLLGGVYADALDRRRVLLFTQSSMMLFAAVLGFVTITGWVSAPLIYLLAALTASAEALDGPARQAIVPNLVPKEHLANAVSLNNMMRQVAAIAGPTLAGFTIALVGIAAVYWINAVSFLAMLVSLVLVRTPVQQHLGGTRITLVALVEGIRHVRESPILLWTTLLDFLATFFSSATALLPIFARDILRVGPQGLGILYAAQSVGALAAGVGIALSGNVRRKGAILLVAVAGYGMATILFGASQWFLLSCVFLSLVGASDTVSTITRNTVRQLATPDRLRGRVTSVNMVFSRGGPHLGNLEAGLVAAVVGAPLSVIVGGVATVLLVGLTARFVPELRRYQD